MHIILPLLDTSSGSQPGRIYFAEMSLPLLGEVVALFVVSVLIAYLCYRIRLVPIAGFLIAGVLIGPGALGLVSDTALIYDLAEIGVILLLFTIGAEFSLEKLGRIKRFVLIGGSLQAMIMVVLVTLVLAAFGIGWRVGVFTSFLVVLSSTVIVLKLFQERAAIDTPAGQVSLGLLIFQDLAMIMMVLFIPALSGEGGSSFDIFVILAKVLIILVLVLVLARRAIPWLLEKIAQTRRQELFLLAVVAVCFGTAWFTSLFGISLALGAFLAGLVVSESRFSGYALSEILPLRTVFNAIFFVSIGMLLDLGFLIDNLMVVIAVAGSVLVLKVIVTTGTVMMLGYPVRIAAFAGFALAQICESSFVLERAGAAVGMTPAGLGGFGEQTFIAVAVLLMVLTPFMMQAGPRFGEWLSRTPLARSGHEPISPPPLVAELENHVIVIGYGPAGRRLVRVMQTLNIPFVILELNPQTAKEIEQEGLPLLYGDASRIHILELAGIERAKICAVVINDPAAVRRIVEIADFLNPTVQIIARARFITEASSLQAIGADIVVPEELETSVRIFSHVLDAYLVSAEEIASMSEIIRRGDYEALRETGESRPLRGLRELDEQGSMTRVVTVRDHTLAAGKTLSDLALRKLYGLTVIAVRRNGTTVSGPDGAFVVEPGDRLVMLGSSDRFAECAHLFRR